MEIQIDSHTLERAEERGATKEEIIDVITNGTPIQANHGRLAKAKVYPYGKFGVINYSSKNASRLSTLLNKILQ